MAGKRAVPSESGVVSQLSAAVVSAEAVSRAAAEAASMARQDTALNAAMLEVARVREFVNDSGNIIGSELTKHGEIAEHVEVGIRRARESLEDLTPTAWKDPLRIGPTDYVIGDVDVQSKFVNGVARNLDHVLEHMRTYPNFGRDGSYYHIPHDHFEIIEKALRGEGHEGLSPKTLATITRKVQEIRELSGQRDFSQVVRPGISDYADVQQGRVHSTLDDHVQHFGSRDSEIRVRIRRKHGPSLRGAATAAAAGAMVGAGVRLTSIIWTKHKEGKRLLSSDYNLEDWQECGLEAALAGAQGGVTAAAIYGLTNYASLAAPLAGAFVSSAAAVADLTREYHAGRISLDEFCELGQVVCLEGAMVGLAAAAGQSLVPVPMLGAAVGAIAGRMLFSLSSGLRDRDSEALRLRLEAEQDQRILLLDSECRASLAEIIQRYDELGTLTALAFDQEMNMGLRLAASVALARAHGVAEARILHSPHDVDRFLS